MARWPYRFVLESLGPGISRRDLDTDLRRREDQRGRGGCYHELTVSGRENFGWEANEAEAEFVSGWEANEAV